MSDFEVCQQPRSALCRTTPQAKPRFTSLYRSPAGEGAFGIKTITATSLISGISRPSIQAAVLLLQNCDDALVTDVLNGRRPLIQAAKSIRNRARLIQDFRAASPEDRAAFGHAVGVATLFDSAVAPSL